MADLEEHAFRRDKGFIVRLVLMLGVALVAGLFVYAQLTSDRTAGCAARTFGSDDAPAEDAPAEDAPAEPAPTADP